MELTTLTGPIAGSKGPNSNGKRGYRDGKKSRGEAGKTKERGEEMKQGDGWCVFKFSLVQPMVLYFVENYENLWGGFTPDITLNCLYWYTGIRFLVDCLYTRISSGPNAR